MVVLAGGACVCVLFLFPLFRWVCLWAGIWHDGVHNKNLWKFQHNAEEKSEHFFLLSVMCFIVSVAQNGKKWIETVIWGDENFTNKVNIFSGFCCFFPYFILRNGASKVISMYLFSPESVVLFFFALKCNKPASSIGNKKWKQKSIVDLVRVLLGN